jgi:ATP-dependent DNA helicase RecQ
LKPVRKVQLPRWARRARPGPPAQFKAGDRVRVPRYGEGRVESASAAQVEIVFPDGQTRSFVASYVKVA